MVEEGEQVRAHLAVSFAQSSAVAVAGCQRADSDEAARVYRAKTAHRSDLMAPTILI